MPLHSIRVVGPSSGRITNLRTAPARPPRDGCRGIGPRTQDAGRRTKHRRGTGSGPAQPATEFAFLGLSDGSCVVNLEAPTLAQAAPRTFAQGSLFLDNSSSAIRLWQESLADALAADADSDRIEALLKENA